MNHRLDRPVAAGAARAVVLAAALSVVLAGVLPVAAGAAVFDVDNAGDDAGTGGCAAAGPCSLRQAITSANATSTPDTITFNAAYDIAIATPLPSPVFPLTIDASSPSAIGTNVAGGLSYAGAVCSVGDYALDLTTPAAFPTTIRALPFSAVCNRAIKSGVPSPTINIGPRRADNTLPVTGAAGGGTEIDIFRADDPGLGSRESGPRLASVSGNSGSYYHLPSPELSPGGRLTATTSGGSGTSNFAQGVDVPADITSPVPGAAVAVSNSRVRLDFNETIAGGSVVPAEFSLGMANQARPVIAAGAIGNSVFLDTNLPWNSGESGGLSVTGNGRVTDLTGNELLGAPGFTVFAGPGELDVPVISSFRFSPNRFCKKVTRRCKRAKTNFYITLNKPARVIFKVLRGTVRKREMVTFVRRLKAGRNKVKFQPVVSGKRLPATTMTLRAVAEDVARSRSMAVETPFRIVKDRRLL
ncbi:MAG: hypothetical protein WAO61_06345 [Solirubrobacterales bacterium]